MKKLLFLLLFLPGLLKAQDTLTPPIANGSAIYYANYMSNAAYQIYRRDSVLGIDSCGTTIDTLTRPQAGQTIAYNDNYSARVAYQTYLATFNKCTGGMNVSDSIAKYAWLKLGNSNVNASVNFIGLNDTSTCLAFKLANVQAGFMNTEGSTFLGEEAGMLTPLYASTDNTGIGNGALSANTTGSENTAIGYECLSSINNVDNVGVGWNVAETGFKNVVVGWNSQGNGGFDGILGAQSNCAGEGDAALGYGNSTAFDFDILIGFEAVPTAANQMIVGGDGQISAGVHFNGVSSVNNNPIALYACGGSNLNQVGSSFTIFGGASTGNALGGIISFKVTPPSSSSSTPNTPIEAMRISGTGVPTMDTALAVNTGNNTVAGSTNGTATFSQTDIGTGFKRLVVYCGALLGTASYTFPVSFQHTPAVVTTNQLASSIVTTLTTTTITITGTTSTGYIFIEGN